MIESDKKEFAQYFQRLASAYPAWKLSAPEQKTQMREYWEVLVGFELLVIRKAFEQAPAAMPKKFPSAGALKELAKGIKRGLGDTGAPKLKQKKKDLSHIPLDPSEQEIYMRGAYKQEWTEKHCAFEFIARRWECESVAKGIQPDSRTPDSIHKRRMEEFWKIWNSPCNSKEQQSKKEEASNE